MDINSVRVEILGVKGGVGKTTIAVHLSKDLATQGKRVLFIDKDFNGWGSSALGVTSRGLLWWIANGGPKDFVREVRRNLTVLRLYPTSPEFYDLMLRIHKKTELMSEGGKVYKEILTSEEFDYCIVDNPVNTSSEDEGTKHEIQFFFMAKPRERLVGLFVSDPSSAGLRATWEYLKGNRSWVDPIGIVVNMIPPLPDEVERVRRWLKENCVREGLRICEGLEFDDRLYDYRNFANPEIEWEGSRKLVKLLNEMVN
jgi:ATPases involved in chromosome partitioning